MILWYWYGSIMPENYKTLIISDMLMLHNMRKRTHILTPSRSIDFFFGSLNTNACKDKHKKDKIDGTLGN